MFDMQNAVLLALQALVRHISSAAACQITMPLDATLLGLADSSIRPSIRSLRQTTRDSLASTWRSQKCGRLDYEQRASSALQLKLKELGPALLPALQKHDVTGAGFVQQHELQKVLLVHFGVLLSQAELDCLKAEWQVLDPVALTVDYASLCSHCSPVA